MNEVKTSKIKSIRDVKEHNNRYGTTYYHNLELDNGDRINIGKKEPQKIGNELTYEIIGDLGQHEYTKAKSALKPEQKKNNDAYIKGIEVGHAINNAVNMLCAGVEFNNVDNSLPTGQKIEAYASNIMLIAEKLKNE